MIGNLTWKPILRKIQQALGFTPAALRAKLRETSQGRDESAENFIFRFTWLKEEGGVGEAEARDLLLSHLNGPTLRLLGDRLEVMLNAGALPEGTTAELVPFDTISNLLARRGVLSEYPCRPSSLNLSVDKAGQNSIN